MATTETTLPDIKARPYDALQLKDVYQASDEYTDGIDFAATETATDALIDATSLSSEDKTALKAAITAAIAANIQAPAFVAILDTVNEDYIGLAESDTTTNPPSGLTFNCPQCLSTGLAAVYEPDGTPTGDTIECPTCSGYGKTAVQYILDPNKKVFIISP